RTSNLERYQQPVLTQLGKDGSLDRLVGKFQPWQLRVPCRDQSELCPDRTRDERNFLRWLGAPRHEQHLFCGGSPMRRVIFLGTMLTLVLTLALVQTVQADQGEHGSQEDHTSHWTSSTKQVL